MLNAILNFAEEPELLKSFCTKFFEAEDQLLLQLFFTVSLEAYFLPFKTIWELENIK